MDEGAALLPHWCPFQSRAVSRVYARALMRATCLQQINKQIFSQHRRKESHRRQLHPSMPLGQEVALKSHKESDLQRQQAEVKHFMQTS